MRPLGQLRSEMDDAIFRAANHRRMCDGCPRCQQLHAEQINTAAEYAAAHESMLKNVTAAQKRRRAKRS